MRAVKGISPERECCIEQIFARKFMCEGYVFTNWESTFWTPACFELASAKSSLRKRKGSHRHWLNSREMSHR